MTTKHIEFVAAPRGNRGSVTLAVELNTLSPTARRLAEIISTTVYADDLSVVVVEYPWTERDCQAAAGWSKARLDELETVYGAGTALRRDHHRWDALRCRRGRHEGIYVPLRDATVVETAAEYLERHAAALDRAGARILGGLLDRLPHVVHEVRPGDAKRVPATI